MAATGRRHAGRPSSRSDRPTCPALRLTPAGNRPTNRVGCRPSHCDNYCCRSGDTAERSRARHLRRRNPPCHRRVRRRRRLRRDRIRCARRTSSRCRSAARSRQPDRGRSAAGTPRRCLLGSGRRAAWHDPPRRTATLRTTRQGLNAVGTVHLGCLWAPQGRTFWGRSRTGLSRVTNGP